MTASGIKREKQNVNYLKIEYSSSCHEGYEQRAKGECNLERKRRLKKEKVGSLAGYPGWSKWSTAKNAKIDGCRVEDWTRLGKTGIREVRKNPYLQYVRFPPFPKYAKVQKRAVSTPLWSTVLAEFPFSR